VYIINDNENISKVTTFDLYDDDDDNYYLLLLLLFIPYISMVQNVKKQHFSRFSKITTKQEVLERTKLPTFPT
jgi:hypothetical protein